MNAEAPTTEKTPAEIAKAPCAPKAPAKKAAKKVVKKAPAKKAAPKAKGKVQAKKESAPKVTGTTPKQLAGDLDIDPKVFRQRLRRMVEAGTIKLEHNEGKRWGFSAGDVAKIKAAFSKSKKS